MDKLRQLIVCDKWDTYALPAATDEELYQSAMELLKQRNEQGFWYDNWNSGNPSAEYKTRAEAIIESGDGRAAWRFLQERSEFEYENVWLN